MLFQQHVLDGIRDGSITLAFRRWRRPSVRAGGTLLTPIGQLTIAALAPVSLSDVTEADARRAGCDSLAVLLARLRDRDDGTVYRIELGPLRADPRVALRESATLSADERQQIAARLQRLDARAARPWTQRTLHLIGERPAVRAADLCRELGEGKLPFKTNVRKLKALGLTESLEVGYRLSPRGAAYVASAHEPDSSLQA